MNYLVSSISDLSDSVPLIIFLFANRRERQRLAVWQSLSFTILLCTLILAENGVHNLILYNIYGVLELVFVGPLLLRKRALFLSLLRATGAVIGIIYIILFPNPAEFHSITRSLESLILIVHCYYYLFDLYKNPRSTLLKDFNFWLVAAYLFYLTSSFFTYLLLSDIIIQRANELLDNAWLISSFTFILKNLVVAFAIYFCDDE